MKDDPMLRERLVRAEERQGDFLAQQVAAGDERPGQPEAAAGEVEPRARVRFRSEGDEPSRGGAPDTKRARPETEGDATGDLPLPDAGDEEDLVEEAADVPGSKRPRFGSESEDPSNPEVEVGAMMFGVLDRRSLPHVDRPGKYDVCEVFSPPRVAPHAAKRGMRAGWSGITGRRWDLLNVKEREMAFDLVRRDKPHTVILSPPCTKFCALLRLCRNRIDRGEWLDAVRMVNTAVRITEMQLDGGRHVVFEHPLTAGS